MCCTDAVPNPPARDAPGEASGRRTRTCTRTCTRTYEVTVVVPIPTGPRTRRYPRHVGLGFASEPNISDEPERHVMHLTTDGIVHETHDRWEQLGAWSMRITEVQYDDFIEKCKEQHVKYNERLAFWCTKYVDLALGCGCFNSGHSVMQALEQHYEGTASAAELRDAHDKMRGDVEEASS